MTVNFPGTKNTRATLETSPQQLQAVSPALANYRRVKVGLISWTMQLCIKFRRRQTGHPVFILYLRIRSFRFIPLVSVTQHFIHCWMEKKTFTTVTDTLISCVKQTIYIYIVYTTNPTTSIKGRHLGSLSKSLDSIIRIIFYNVLPQSAEAPLTYDERYMEATNSVKVFQLIGVVVLGVSPKMWWNELLFPLLQFCFSINVTVCPSGVNKTQLLGPFDA